MCLKNITDTYIYCIKMYVYIYRHIYTYVKVYTYIRAIGLYLVIMEKDKLVIVNIVK